MEIVSGDPAPSAADDTDFGIGQINTGLSSVRHIFTITNSGQGPLYVSPPSPSSSLIQISGPDAADFAVGFIPILPIPENGGASTFAIDFRPTAPGLRTAMVTVSNNDSDEGIYTFTIQGVGAIQPGVAVALDYEQPNQLVHFDPAGTSTAAVELAITGVVAGESIVAFHLRPRTGQFLAFGVDSMQNHGTLYDLNTTTGIATPIGTPGSVAFVDAQGDAILLPGFPASPYFTQYDMAVDPYADLVRVVTNGLLNFRISPQTGLPVDGNLGATTPPPAGINPDAPFPRLVSGALRGIAYTDSIAHPKTTALYTLEWTIPSQNVRYSEFTNRGPSSGYRSTTILTTPAVQPFDGRRILLGFDIPSNVTATGPQPRLPTGYGYVLAATRSSSDCEILRVDFATGVVVSAKPLGRLLFSLALLSTPFEPAAVSRPTVRNVTEQLATIEGETTSDGGTGYVDAGVLLSKTSDNADPKLGDPNVIVQHVRGGVGAFSTQVTGLLPETKYSYRVFASNTPDQFEVAYSAVQTFKTDRVPDFQGEADFVISDGAKRRIFPLRNDASPTGAPIHLFYVNDALIGHDEQSLYIPAGYTGTFTYRFFDGTKVGQASVYVSSVRQRTVYSSLLRDRTDAIVGSADVAFSPNLRAATVLLKVRSSVLRLVVKFPPNNPIAFRPTAFGNLFVATNENGLVSVDLIPENDADRLTATLQPRYAAGPRARYHLALAATDGVIRGGGFATATVLPSRAVLITAVLPDGSVFSSSTSLREDNTIAVYSAVGRNVRPPSVVAGELVLADLATTDLTGEWSWRKPPQEAGVRGLHLGGVDTLLGVAGSRYDGRLALTGPGVLGIDGGDLLPRDELGENVAVIGGRPNLPLGVLQSWVTVPKYGVFFAGLKIPDRPGVVRGRGLYLPKSNSAAGFFPGTTVGGRIVLSGP